jgi:hypothetical protein
VEKRDSILNKPHPLTFSKKWWKNAEKLLAKNLREVSAGRE